MSTRFSLVIPVYNAAGYLPAFLASLEAQGDPLARTEILLIDDGSTDGSGAILETWAAARPQVHLIRRDNGGPSAARNDGLDRATGEWVLFPDPDDELPASFLTALDDYLTDHAEYGFDLVAVPRIIRDERSGRVKDTHPLRGLFAQGERVVSLDHTSAEFQMALNSGAVRRAALEETGLRFDVRVRPTFEDAHLIGRLLVMRGTGLGICTRTEYRWTRRSGGDSVTQSSWRRPERYDDVFRTGYLDLLSFAQTQLGHVPNWVARMVLYDLQWYLRMDRKRESPLRDLDRATLDRLEEHFTTALRAMDARHVEAFDLCPDPEVLAGLRSFRDDAFALTPATLHVRDRRPHAIEYVHCGARPAESVLVGGAPTIIDGREEPVEVFGRPRLVRRRIAIDARVTDEIELQLDGRPVPLARTETTSGRAAALPPQARRALRWLSARVPIPFGPAPVRGPQ